MQGVTGGYNGLQEVTRVFLGVKGVRGYKGFQKVRRKYKGLQEVKRGYRGYKKLQGVTMG